jgi:hypothetical protein
MGTSGTNADTYGMVKRHLHPKIPKQHLESWRFHMRIRANAHESSKKNAKNKQTALGKKRTPNIIKPQHVENHWQH